MGRTSKRRGAGGGDFFSQVLLGLTKPHSLRQDWFERTTCVDLGARSECPNYPSYYENLRALYSTQARFAVHEAVAQVRDALQDFRGGGARSFGKRAREGPLPTRPRSNRAIPVRAVAEKKRAADGWGGGSATDHRKVGAVAAKRYFGAEMTCEVDKWARTEAERRKFAEVARAGSVVLLRAAGNGRAFACLAMCRGTDRDRQGVHGGGGVLLRFDTCPCSEKMFAAFGADWTCEYVTSVLNLKRMFDVCRQRPKCTFGYLLLGWKKSKHTYLGSSDDEAAAPARSPVPEVLLLEDAAVDPQVAARLAGLNPSQAAAVRACVRVSSASSRAPSPLVLLQGPPGTGKTRTIASLLSILFEQTALSHVAVCAPTNKAVHVVMTMLLQQQRFSPLDLVLVGVDEHVPEHLRPFFIHDGAERFADALKVFFQHVAALEDALVGSGAGACLDRVQGVLATLGSAEVYLPSMHVANNLADPTLSSLVAIVADALSEMSAVTKALRSGPAEEEMSAEDGIAVLEACVERLQAVASRWPTAPISSDVIEPILLREAKVRFCTLSVAGRSSLKRGPSVDVLIVDEAAQAIEAETLIALSMRPKQLILVGDPCQLSSKLASQEATRYGFDKSLMYRLMQAGGLPYQMLDLQYRMRPEISRWPSKQFYGAKVKDAANVRAPSWSLGPVAGSPWLGPLSFLDCPSGKEERDRRGSYSNRVEVETTVKVVKSLERRGRLRVIVISFYRAQITAMKRAFSRHGVERTQVHSVDSFQGSESDVVVVSFVRTSRNVGFLNDCRRLNVAITRAKFSLLLVGNFGTLRRCTARDIVSLMEHVEGEGRVYRYPAGE